MMQVFELISLYIDVNEEIITKRLDSANQYFINITSCLKKMRINLQKLQVHGMDNTSIWNVYKKDAMTEQDLECLINYSHLPDLSQNPENKKVIQKLESNIEEFLDNITRAHRKCCFCMYNRLFGTNV